MPGRGELDEALALALAKGATVARAAALAGCSERTVYRRLKGSLREKVRQLRAEMVGSAVGRLSALGGKAAGTLGKLLRDPDAKVKRQAADSILAHLARYTENEELRAELDELRRQLEEMKRERGGDAEGSGPAGGNGEVPARAARG